MRNLLSNWKTTVGGVVIALAYIFAQLGWMPENPSEITQLVAMIWALFFAGDGKG